MRKDSFDVASAFQQAFRFHQAGQLAQAKEIYRRITKADPTHFESRHLLGVIHHQLGNHWEADRQIRLALNINPRGAACGVVLQHLKRLDDALMSYDRAIALEPNDAVSFYNRGNVKTRCGYCTSGISHAKHGRGSDKAYLTYASDEIDSKALTKSVKKEAWRDEASNGSFPRRRRLL